MAKTCSAYLLCVVGFVSTGCLATLSHAQELPYLTTATPLVLLSANDGAVLNFLNPDLDLRTDDSITLIRLGPDHPPIVRTVYGTVPNTIAGPPHMAIAGNGRYGFITSNSLNLFASGLPKVDGASSKQPAVGEPNLLSIVDLESVDLRVVKKFFLPPFPVMAVAHPDGKRVLVGGGHFFHVVTVGKKMDKIDVTEHKTSIFISGFAVSPDGKTILATGTDSPRKEDNPFVDWEMKAHLFEWTVGSIKYLIPVADGKFEGSRSRPKAVNGY